MNFKVSDWDNNDLGDKTHSKLFKTKPEIKNEEIIKPNNLTSKVSENKTSKRNKRRTAEKQKYKNLKKKPEQKNDLSIQKVETDSILTQIEKKKLNNKKRCLKKRQLIKDYKKIAHTLETNPNTKNVEIIKNFVVRKKPEKIVVDIEEKRKKNKLKKELKRLQKKQNKSEEITKQNKTETTIVEKSLNSKKKKQNKTNGSHESNKEELTETNKQKEESKTIVNNDNGEAQEKKTKKQLKRLQNKQPEIETITETSINEIKKQNNDNGEAQEKKSKKQLKRLQNKQSEIKETITETSINEIKKKTKKQNKKLHNEGIEKNIETSQEKDNSSEITENVKANTQTLQENNKKTKKQQQKSNKLLKINEKSNTNMFNQEENNTQDKKLKKELKRLQNKQSEIKETGAETPINEIKKKQKKKQNKKLNEEIPQENKKQLQNKELKDNSSEITENVKALQENNKKTKKQQQQTSNKLQNINEKSTTNIFNPQENKKLKKQLKRLQNKNMKNQPNSSEIHEINVDQNKPKVHEKHLKNVLKLKEKLINANETKANINKSVNPLRAKMLAKLKAARFRFINEQMYTNESKNSQKLFQQDPAAFAAYHDGYRQQVSKWPMNPLDTIITAIKKMPSDYKIADFGCGDARLAKSIPHKVYSFDLVSNDPNVVACDMAHCPLKKNEVDVVLFCLSLMGTNLKDYLFEANRVLKIGGILKIAEVESRFEGVEQFIDGLVRFGFTNTWKDLSHNLFYFLNFKKDRDIMNKNKLPTLGLSPCLYKKR